MKAALLIFFYLSILGCSSSPVKQVVKQDAESKYRQALPAMGKLPTEQSKQKLADLASGNPEPVLQEQRVDGSSDVAKRDQSERFVSAVSAELLIDLESSYTLQLVAVQTMQACLDYAKKYNIDADKAGVATILSNGQILYVLAYGVFPDQQTAQQEKQKLQDSGVPEPWIRNLSALEMLAKQAQ